MGQKSRDKEPLRDKPIREVSAVLQQTLGQRLVAYAVCESDPGQIGAYARSEAMPDQATESTLRDLAQVAETLLENESPAVVRALTGRHESSNQ